EVNENNPFDSLKLEGWYEMNIWSHLIDPAFYNVNINLIHSEEMSFASSDRKNVERTTNDRKKAGREWKEQSETKYITDSLKICKMLKDMLNQLAIKYNMKEDYVRKLYVVEMLQ
ncbi:6884_t:CDS:2, partial [Scutellospora calospora]